jgi:hypothetical protein
MLKIFISIKKVILFSYVLSIEYKIKLKYYIAKKRFINKNTSSQNPSFFFDSTAIKNSEQYLNKKKVCFDADRICEKIFNFLGLSELRIDNQIMWHRDYLAGCSCPNYFYTRLIYIFSKNPSKIGLGYDRKQPYELSRFQHLVPLCNAFILSGDSKYSKEVICQIDDWINKNKFMYGINWTCTMDVAIRACNWIWSWWVARDDPMWTEKFNDKFIKSLWQHGWYIEHNLENRNNIRTNHYLSNIVGLLFISIMFPQFKDAQRWMKFSIEELVQCMETMVYSDGVCFENSTAYHRLVLELFIYSAILCKKNRIILPLKFWNHIEKMIEFVMYCTYPNGRVPMIGDNDDGRFFILSNYYTWDRWDYRYLLSIGAVLFKRTDFKIAAGRFWEEGIWVLSENDRSKFDDL